jgi:hypothetical protein
VRSEAIGRTCGVHIECHHRINPCEAWQTREKFYHHQGLALVKYLLIYVYMGYLNKLDLLKALLSSVCYFLSLITPHALPERSC